MMACPAALTIQPKIGVSRSSQPRCAWRCSLTGYENCSGRGTSDSVCLGTNCGQAQSVGGDMLTAPGHPSAVLHASSHRTNCTPLAPAVVRKQNDTAFPSETEAGNAINQTMFVSWFRKAWPYIQGHRSSVFVVVLPGDVIADSSKIDGVLQVFLLPLLPLLFSGSTPSRKC